MGDGGDDNGRGEGGGGKGGGDGGGGDADGRGTVEGTEEVQVARAAVETPGRRGLSGRKREGREAIEGKRLGRRRAFNSPLCSDGRLAARRNLPI